jgi:LuxR family maltose regulon positive regulatory protein
MAMPVLATKLFVPPVRPHAVERTRLVDRLRDGMHSGSKLTLISAPAGFGKTSLLSEWIADARRRSPALRVAWLSLDENDDDPARFLAYLVAALHEADPAVGAEDAGAQAEAALTALLNDVTASGSEFLLVLDDFQLVEDAAIRDAVSYLLDHLPSTLHLAIASRSDPMLPVARLRASGQLTELRAGDLRFTADEATTFLNQATGLELAPDDVVALEARTEGWIAGLQLAALSMRNHSDVSGFIRGFTGSHRFVIDYLAEEVLQRQPEHVREFLVLTSVLDRLTGSLCDALTGQIGGSETLATLERDNLFVVPLDEARQWYRYHHLFADVLRARLLATAPERVPQLHSLASGWYESAGLTEEAVRHALAAGDFDRAARVMEAAVPAIRKSRQDASLLHWLTLLPKETVSRRPVLSVFSAWSALVAGDVPGAEPWLVIAEGLIASGDHESEPGAELETVPVTIALYRAALAQARGDLPAIHLHAQRALDLAAPDDHLGRGAAAGLLGLASWATGDLEAGVRAFAESKSSLRLAGNDIDAMSTTMVLGDMLIPLGRLRDAQAGYEEALRQAAALGTPALLAASDLHAGVSELFLERNARDAALDHLVKSDAISNGVHSHEHRYRWFVAMASVRAAEGDLDASLAMLGTAEGFYRRGFFPEVRPIAGLKARLFIRQGRLPEAQAWVDVQATAEDYPAEFANITRARLLIAQGSVDDALGLLGRLLAAAEAGRRVGTVIELLVLQALAGEQTLHRALTLAEAEGYARVFLDEGEPMIALLRAAEAAGIHPEYVRRLLDDATVPDALSERELHVLRLLASALTGPEIARELYVSLNTMRTHTKNIFSKLHVKSRTEAVRRGIALGLLTP